MPATLYVVYGSHPCATAARALDLKGIAYRTVELPPPAHAAIMRVLFGRRTVPGIRFEDGEKVSGSRAILRHLDERVPEPPLLPADAAERARVLEAERWGDEVLQSAARLQRVDDWLADGTLGAEPPNAADLQIAPSLKLLMAMDDLRAIIDPRPCGAWADRLFPATVGHLPPGAIPAEVLPVGA